MYEYLRGILHPLWKRRRAFTALDCLVKAHLIEGHRFRCTYISTGHSRRRPREDFVAAHLSAERTANTDKFKFPFTASFHDLKQIRYFSNEPEGAMNEGCGTILLEMLILLSEVIDCGILWSWIELPRTVSSYHLAFSSKT